MPARFPCTGPCEFFVSVTGPGGAYAFLGTAEVQPQISILPAYKPVFNDYGGSLTPMDRQYMGEEALVALESNRLDLTVYGTIAGRALSGGPGVDVFGNMGALMLSGAPVVSLVVRFPYSGSPNNVAAGQPAGYRFFATVLEQPTDIKPGTDVEKVMLIFRAMRIFTGRDGTTSGGIALPPGAATPGGFGLYDFTMPTLPVPT